MKWVAPVCSVGYTANGGVDRAESSRSPTSPLALAAIGLPSDTSKAPFVMEIKTLPQHPVRDKNAF